MGFEPTDGSAPSAVFKTAAFSHSAISPDPTNPYFTRLGTASAATDWYGSTPFAHICSREGSALRPSRIDAAKASTAARPAPSI